MKQFKSELLFVLFIATFCGFALTMYSWDGLVYFIEQHSGRTPAKFSDTKDPNSIKSKKFNQSIQKILLNDTIKIETSENLSFKFKTFYTASNENICNKFSKIKVSFHAMNVSVSGETPQITIEKPCKIEKEGYLTNIKFPKKMLSTISLAEKIIKYDDQTIHLVEIYDQMPAQFIMKDVLFYNSRDKASGSSSFKVNLDHKNNDFIIKL